MIKQDFDRRALANMEVALERACANIPNGEKHRARKRIANRIIRCAGKGVRTLEALSEAGRLAAMEIHDRTFAE
ncbi:hypothetical protein [Nitrobacter hamburgensis]|uniref:hypothetical protein n=1 Tax=Nitrobacter hamburgensis TaxID=912 RepID=UPI0009D6CC0E|nr:hypothetical protein [Nitrobacter hamburgensis]